jgi:hypothetical protein
LKGLSSKQIADLNRDYDGGKFFEAMIVTRDMNADPQVKDYFCNFSRPITFEGNVYQPEAMSFDSSFTMSEAMELPTVKINLLNIGGVIDSYLHDPTVRIRQNDVIQQILHIDRRGIVTEYDRDRLQIQVISGTAGKGTATIYAGLNMRLSDRVPRQTLETNEFPGIRADVIRSGT